MAAAERLLAEHDPLTVTFAEVAVAAGVSRPLVHSYLGDRRGLHDAVQIAIIGRLDRWVGHGLDRADRPMAKLRALAHALSSFADQEREAWAVLVHTGGLDHPAMHQLRRRWQEGLTESGSGGGTGPDPIGADLVLRALLGGIGGWAATGEDPGAIADRLAPLLRRDGDGP